MQQVKFVVFSTRRSFEKLVKNTSHGAKSQKYDFAGFDFISKILFSGLWTTGSAMHATIGRAKQPKRLFHRRQDLLRKRYVAAFVKIEKEDLTKMTHLLWNVLHFRIQLSNHRIVEICVCTCGLYWNIDSKLMIIVLFHKLRSMVGYSDCWIRRLNWCTIMASESSVSKGHSIHR